jgi:hypothetical protein
MADTSNVRILYGDNGAGDPLNLVHIPILTATVVAKGDLIKYVNTSGGAVVVGANTDNVYFRGISLFCSRTGETDPIQVLLRGRCTITTVSADYDIGDALTYNAGANGTDWVLAAVSSGSKGMFWAMEYKASATSLTVQWDSFLIGTSIGSGSGPWESFAA